jgi:hypothetical protein
MVKVMKDLSKPLPITPDFLLEPLKSKLGFSKIENL